MVKKVITNIDSSKESSPHCIPVLVLKNCEPELSYILAKLFSMCLKVSCFPDCWKVSSVVPVLRLLGKGLLVKTTKVFEKLINNRIADHLVNCGFFSDFQLRF